MSDNIHVLGHVVFGAGLIIPIDIPYNYSANIERIRVFVEGGAWESVTFNKYVDEPFIRCIYCSGIITPSDHTENYSILCAVEGTFTKKII